MTESQKKMMEIAGIESLKTTTPDERIDAVEVRIDETEMTIDDMVLLMADMIGGI